MGGIALRRLGASTNAVSTLLQTLQRMKYQVRTSIGLSEGIILSKAALQSLLKIIADCKAAFDRMIPSVGGIALRRLGASTNVVSTLLQTLQRMKYQVRSSLGLSDQAFSNLNGWVLGTLQG